MDELTRPILLLTDFGLSDHYAGQVRSILHSLAPSSTVIDITHGIEKYAIDEGAWMLETALAAAPDDAVVMAVVDPGVGSGRKAICVESGGRSFIGPDNGLLSCAFNDDQRDAGGVLGKQSGTVVHELSEPRFRRADVSHTFHGRDVFAPAAAARARGVPVTELGSPLDHAEVLPTFRGTVAADRAVTGEIIHVDSYGNLVTTIREHQLPADFVVEAAGRTIEGRSHTFSDAAVGSLLTHIDSSGFLAIAANLGNAAAELCATRGAVVTVRPR